jgi:preprotein translocase subunit Sec63
MSDDPEINPYELFGLSTDATDQDIRTAYRKVSLKVHPDRVRVAYPSHPRSHSSCYLERIEITQKQVCRSKTRRYRKLAWVLTRVIGCRTKVS